MNTKSETPLIDLTYKLYSAVKRSQMALAAWIVPDSGISDSECLNQLLGILDDNTLCREMREAMGDELSDKPILSQPAKLTRVWLEKDSVNIAKIEYHLKGLWLNIEFRNGKVYQYREVPAEIGKGFINTDKVAGVYWVENLKGYYSYIELT